MRARVGCARPSCRAPPPLQPHAAGPAPPALPRTKSCRTPRVEALGVAGDTAFLAQSWENDPRLRSPLIGTEGLGAEKRFSGGQGEEVRQKERKQNFAKAQSGRLDMFLTGSQRRR